MKTELIELAITQTPAIVAGIKALFVKANPGLPVPTDAEVIEAARDAFLQSLAKDDAWLAAHPNWKTDGVPPTT